MKKFLVTASDDSCRDGQFVDFEEMEELGKTEIDVSSGDGDWRDFSGEFVLDTLVKANSE